MNFSGIYFYRALFSINYVAQLSRQFKSLTKVISADSQFILSSLSKRIFSNVYGCRESLIVIKFSPTDARKIPSSIVFFFLSFFRVTREILVYILSFFFSFPVSSIGVINFFTLCVTFSFIDFKSFTINHFFRLRDEKNCKRKFLRAKM